MRDQDSNLFPCFLVVLLNAFPLFRFWFLSFFLALCSWLSFLDDSGNLLLFRNRLGTSLVCVLQRKTLQEIDLLEKQMQEGAGSLGWKVWLSYAWPPSRSDDLSSAYFAFPVRSEHLRLVVVQSKFYINFLFFGIFWEYIDPSSLLGSPEADSVTLSRCIAQVKQESDEQVEYEGLCLTRVCDFPRCYAFLIPGRPCKI